MCKWHKRGQHAMADAEFKIEYSRDNRFPFHSKEETASIYKDDHEDYQEMDFIYDKVVEKYPSLKAEEFYGRLYEIQTNKSGDKVKMVKEASDRLLANIKEFLSDEAFVHELHSKWGFGIDKVI